MKEWIYAKESDTLLKPVQELVRCKDCKHYSGERYKVCWYFSSFGPPIDMAENYFCSFGERKENG